MFTVTASSPCQYFCVRLPCTTYIVCSSMHLVSSTNITYLVSQPLWDWETDKQMGEWKQLLKVEGAICWTQWPGKDFISLAKVPLWGSCKNIVEFSSFVTKTLVIPSKKANKSRHCSCVFGGYFMAIELVFIQNKPAGFAEVISPRWAFKCLHQSQMSHDQGFTHEKKCQRENPLLILIRFCSVVFSEAWGKP